MNCWMKQYKKEYNEEKDMLSGWDGKKLSLKCQSLCQRRRKNLVAHPVKLMQEVCIAIIAAVFHPEDREEWIYGKTMGWDSHLMSFIF